MRRFCIELIDFAWLVLFLLVVIAGMKFCDWREKAFSTSSAGTPSCRDIG